MNRSREENISVVQKAQIPYPEDTKNDTKKLIFNIAHIFRGQKFYQQQIFVMKHKHYKHMIKHFLIPLAIFCLIGAAVAEDASYTLTAEDLANADLLKAINNYYGCKTWKDDVCLECSAHYYFNKKGICCEVKPECRNFNVEVGICQGCYQGYSIKDGVCVLSDLAGSDDKGCKAWKDGVCSQCSARWYFGPNNVCYPVDDLCRTWNEGTGACESCYRGYIVDGAKCVRDPADVAPPADPLCAAWKDGKCEKCSERAYFYNGVCYQVSDHCRTWDNLDGACLSCYQGYDLKDKACVLAEQQGPKDLGCKVWDWPNRKCLECSARWVFNNGVCVSVDNLCQAWDAAGACTACYKGYRVQDGKCVFCNCPDKPQDLGCKTWNWDQQICYECSDKWYYKEGSGCVPGNPLCKAANDNGACTDCYKGYDLKDGACVLADIKGPTDVGCKKWDWDNQKCLECSFRWVFGYDGVCKQVSDHCATWAAYGECTACFKGYEIKDGACVLSEVRGPTDLGCKKWDWDNQKCLECSFRWVFNREGVCTPVSDHCATWADYGECTACYKGYEVKDGACVASEVRGPTDLGCKKWDWDNQKCLECSFRWVFNREGVCTPVSDHCATWADYGECTACYKGYEVKDGACVASEVKGPTDLGCKKWDWDNQKCLECSYRWTFNTAGVCTPVSDHCATWGDYGACTACYKGYEIKDGACVLSEVRGPTDLGCKKWDWDNQKCLECSFRWVFNREGVCTPVSDHCATWADYGECTACYKGYEVKDGACVASEVKGPTDLGCKTWNWDAQKCLECSFRWVFNREGVCTPVSDHCATWADYGECTACYKGYEVKDGACVASEVKGPTDLGCKKWDWDNQKCLECSYRWTFNTAGVCTPVSDHCATWGDYGACTACYKGYEIKDGACVLSEVRGPTDLGCKKWDWDNQKCLECSFRWVFNREGVCTPVSDHCATWADYGECTACYKGYEVKDGACVASEVRGPTDLGCKKWDWDNQKCLECSFRWVFNREGVCTPVSDHCATWADYGECTACYKGYEVKDGACVASEVKGPTDLGCKKWDWDNQKCLECSYRWTFNTAGVCTPVSDHCATWGDYGACTACYKGYEIKDGACVLSEVRGPTDLGCKKWDWDNQKCLECSFRWVFNREGVCTPVSDHCATWADYGECTACYKGYEVKDGACVASEVKGPTDLGCKKWDWDNQKCLECSYRWTFNTAGVCTPVSDHCATWGDYGACTACYKGYEIKDGACVLSEVRGPTDLGCKKWDWDNQKCLECSFRWVFNREGVCTPVSDHCATWADYGECTACYKGYEVKDGACVASEVKGPTDLGCKKWDWDNQKCLECSYRWTFNREGVCTPVSDHCATWADYGECTACYKGYEIKDGACVLSEVRGPTDLGCKKWDWDNQKCLECSFRWVFNREGVCTPVSDHCATWADYGECTACYKGYEVKDGACVASEVKGPTDLGCKKWDWDNQKCLECSYRWTFNREGVCTPVSDHCATWADYGECTACYKGYEVKDGACVASEVRGPTDLGCHKWDWDNQKCLECSFRWVFGYDGVCKQVDDHCATWAAYGECTACYPGYAVNNGKCEVHNVLCKTVAADGNCATCYTGYVLYHQNCVPISKLANLAQYYAQCCPEKLATLKGEKRLL